MKKPLTLVLGLIIPAATLFSQSKFENTDKLLFEKESVSFDYGSGFDPGLAGRTKSAMADYGSPPEWNWVRTFGGSAGVGINDLITDGSGNLYAAGVFSDTMVIESTSYPNVRKTTSLQGVEIRTKEFFFTNTAIF